MKKLLEERFSKNTHRHPNTSWELVNGLLTDSLISVLEKMENSGGEPDVVEINQELYFIDCSKESPAERRSFCYDREALDARKANKPANSAKDVAQEMGVSILTEELYVALQEIEDFDLKTSSWLETPAPVRKLKGAIFGDKRYQRTFIYHNGADSYYAARGFRAYIKLKS